VWSAEGKAKGWWCRAKGQGGGCSERQRQSWVLTLTETSLLLNTSFSTTPISIRSLTLFSSIHSHIIIHTKIAKIILINWKSLFFTNHNVARRFWSKEMVSPEWPFSIDPLLSMLSTPIWLRFFPQFHDPSHFFFGPFCF